MSRPLFRWVVGAETSTQLPQLLWQHGLTQAWSDGRTFVDGRRAGPEPLQLAAGAVVEVFAPRPSASVTILYEADGVLAISKPAALPTEPDKAGFDSVLEQVAELRALPRSRLHAVSRLDVGVSGVLLLADGAAALERLLAARARGELRRRYLALAAAAPTPEQGEWREALGAAGRGRRGAGGAAAQHALTRYRVVCHAQPVAPGAPATCLLALSPVTGRTHQLRVHAALHGAALLGDRKYGGPARSTGPDGSVRSFPQICLHSAWVEWGPSASRSRVTAEPPPELLRVWEQLGGDATAVQRALDWDGSEG